MGAEREGEGPAARVAAVEFGAIEEGAAVVDEDGVAVLGSARALGGLRYGDLEAVVEGGCEG